MTTTGLAVLPPHRWREEESAHAPRVDALTAGHRARARAGQPHPVEDFLFTYYPFRPGQLRRWHPGAGTALADAGDRAQWRFHRVLDGPGSVVTVDLPAFLAARGDQVRFVGRLQATVAATPGQFGCFGLHEWAMVYRMSADDLRHGGRPLRLGREGTDEVVRDHQIRCSHYDAFRFFTAAARPLNQLRPTLEARVGLEQPGCLHTSMDLYKWAYRLLPAVDSDLVVDAFELARAIREVDMRASPYDLTDLGYPAIPIETPAGKAEYVARQREFAERGGRLRRRLLDAVQAIAAAGRPAGDSPDGPTEAHPGTISRRTG
ncbi:3-methyladenine DNA glycosylase [Nakamurella sp.]|uniref:3-methyladenine DNA glycosylase n=1 Tax=Nakamurella sp. TaxID=1869182 RepID=UPI003B3A9FA9